MCYKGKCLFMEVETGALIYAIPNVICTSLGSVICIAMLVYTNILSQALVERANIDGNEQEMAAGLVLGLSSNIILSILTVVCLISFVFAVYLLVGICKRNPHYVKAFFVFGVMKMSLAGIFVLIIISQVPSFMLGLLILTAYAIYGLKLHMIRLTYLKFQKEAPYQAFSNPLALSDKC